MATLEDGAVDLSRALQTPGVPMVGSAADPFRPADFMTAPGAATVPPCCPMCLALLNPMSQNAGGDVLFQCLNDGYQAVWRASAQQWEERPGAERRRWTEPLTLTEAREQAASRQVPAPQPLVKPDPNARPYDDWKTR